MKPAPHPRFVIQKHAARRLHYDLRLEVDGVFKSWAVTRGISLDPADKRLAVEVEDHPLEYGDFEGTIPAGEYGGGTVMLWDRGFWQVEGSVSPADALKAGELKFVLVGEKLQGRWVLVRLKNDGSKRTNWLLIKHRETSPRRAKISKRDDDRSVASGRTMREIASGLGAAPAPFLTAGKAHRADAVWHSNAEAANGSRQPPSTKRELSRLPDFVPPQLCRSSAKPPSGEGWGHEIKLDGYRMQLRVERGVAKLISRSGLDWTSRFGVIASAARSLPDVIIDGEVIALHGDRHDFSELQAAISEGRQDYMVFIAFDLLVADGADIRPLPLRERQQRLAALVARLVAADGQRLRFIGHLEGDGAAVLEAACRMGLEGVVSKRLDEPYRSGRHDSWVKAKCRPGQEVVIGGWSGSRTELRSLLVGVYREGRLVYAGRVGTGFNQRNSTALLAALKKHRASETPFDRATAPRKTADIQWVTPELVAEIEFAGFTKDGMVRQAAFKGLREDKAAGAVVAERAGQEDARSRGPAQPSRMRAAVVTSASAEVVAGVRLSSAGKELWPATDDAEAVTKLDLARYYESAGAAILPHIAGRPCSFVRTPDGIGHEQFFQRHTMPGMSKLVTAVKIDGDRKPYLQIDSVEALVAMAQVAAVELHPWNCAPGEPNIAGRLVFDLDPGSDVPMSMLVEAAKELRERLAGLGLETFCKTSGGKGLHVVTPLASDRGRGVAWPQAKAFAQAVCTQMARDTPERYLITMTKSLRHGRIFLDYLRNDRMSTAVAVLSPRARTGATVSMPLTWSQVRQSLDPQRYRLRSVLTDLKRPDPWADYERAGRPLGPAIERLMKRT